MTLHSLQFGFCFGQLYFGENLWPTEDARWRPMLRSLLRDQLTLYRRMGHCTRQSIGVARLVVTHTTGLPSVCEIDECKPAFGHGRSLAPKVFESRWCQLRVANRVLDILMAEIRLN